MSFIEKYAKDFAKTIEALVDFKNLTIGEIIDKWLVHLQKKQRKCEEWVRSCDIVCLKTMQS